MTAPASAGLPRVVIVGRPNVGKSSLFNRVVGERRAIVEDEPGTTRDRVEADVEWLDRRFRLVDTGGFETSTENVYAPAIVGQIRTAIENADLVLFCIDARDGMTASDYDIAEVVRRANRPTLVLATKADNERRELAGMAEAATLGMGEVMPLSAMHDVNVGVMLDEVVARLPETLAIEESDRVRISIVGRPNVGKSALLNAIVGEERVIVSNVAGTTRDAIDTEVDTPAGKFVLIDTAGVRRPGQLGKGIERHSVMRTDTAIERSDVAVLVIDGSEGVTAQDTHIAGRAMKAQKGLIIAVNKIDLWDDPEARREWADRQMRGRMQFVPWAMVTFISALQSKGLEKLLELAVEVREARRRRISTGELNAVLTKAMRKHAPPVVHGKRLKLLYATQAGIDPPTFILFVNDPAIVHFSYRRFLERALREAYDFEGTAIKLVFRGRTEDNSRS
ncbi:MAG: ribosome biogenesis GTPase Der [Dehalococcoidia bacterium]|nr:ribosome biogenesis GTPase Der [Dehalococcoidia bacterium]